MKPYRTERVASEIRSLISDVIGQHLSDPRVSRFTSVTRVAISADLSYADVYVSVLGSEAEQRTTMKGLAHARGHVQSLVARKMRIRQCPVIRFHFDPSIKKGQEIIRVIDETIASTPPAGPSSDGDSE